MDRTLAGMAGDQPPEVGTADGEYERTIVVMDTYVTIRVCRPASGCAARVARAFEWFRRVEDACSRFDPRSEVMGLTEQIGRAVPVGDLLYQAVAFALAVAEASDGAFDPTIGHALEQRGFNRNYETGETIATDIEVGVHATYRDVALDPARRTITLRRPLVLDLGAVAKGLAIDLAAQELAAAGDSAEGFLIEAGGDLYLHGENAAREPWRVGLRHPRDAAALLGTLRLSDAAVCTSGDYERPAADANAGHHILDPRRGESPAQVASVTVIAPTAMAADALGTAAFVLGSARGRDWLAAQGVEGLIVTPALEQFATPGFAGYLA